MDLTGYEKYIKGELLDYPLPQEDIDKYLKPLEGYPKPKMPQMAD
jgi:tryptophan synthase beta chain